MKSLKNILGLMLFFCSVLYGQNIEEQLKIVENHYNTAAFEKAIVAGQALLKADGPRLSPYELADLHRYLALSHFSINQQDSARSHFFSLLSIQPDMELDPITTSPKIIDFFNAIKQNQRTESTSEISYTRYMFLPDRRPGAGIRSAILPGWGQFYKGQKIKGWVLGSAFWGSAFASGYAWLQEDKRHKDYLASEAAVDIAQKYDSYNQWYKRRRNLLAITAAAWVLTLSDALWSGYAKPSFSVNKENQLLFGASVSF